MRSIKLKFQHMTILSLFVALYLATLTLASLPAGIANADKTEYQVDIATHPAQGFLQAENMAPGDQVTSILEVQNNGNLDFNYTVTSSQESGTTGLYNRLLLSLSDEEGPLFEGFLTDLQNFALGTLGVGEHRNLFFTAELPIETGNEVQGQSTAVAFVFTATGHDQQLPVGDGCFEPPFSNRQFTLHQKSTVPIKFHLRKPNGAFERTARPNVKLVVSGPGIEGGTVHYEFSFHNGILSFHEHHYLARFSTKDYPVVTNGNYTAIVYDGSDLVCQKEFKVLKQGNRSNAPD